MTQPRRFCTNCKLSLPCPRRQTRAYSASIVCERRRWLDTWDTQGSTRLSARIGDRTADTPSRSRLGPPYLRSRFVLRQRNRLYQPFHNIVRRNPFRIGVECSDKSVSQNRKRDCFNVLGRDMQSAVQNRASFATED